MKTFKDFINKDKNTNEPTAGFCSSGGRPDQKLITTTSDSKNRTLAGFCSAGGPRERKLIETKELYDDSNILRDPAADNTVTDRAANDHQRFVTPPKHGYDQTYPHLTDEQTKHYQALANNTQRNHPNYQYSVSNYTDGSHELNSHLYESHISNTPHDPVVQELVVKHLDDLIQQHRTPHSMTVYTGPHFNPADHAGKETILPAFTSTSLSPHVAKDFGMGSHILRIHLPGGHPHLFMDHESTFQGQAELVLPRNMKLRIADTPSHTVSGVFNDHFEDRNPNRLQSTIHFWDAHVVQ